MKFLNHRGYTTPGATGAGAAIYAGGATGARRVHSNTPGGVAGLITRNTRETVGSKSTQVGLSKGPGARARMSGDMPKVHTF
jgi:hypothetical protein